MANLPVSVSSANQARATFEVVAPTEVLVSASGEAYVWGHGGYVQVELVVDGIVQAVARRNGVDPWVGDLQTATSYCFQATPGRSYEIAARESNLLGESRMARIGAFARGPSDMYGSSTGLVSAQVVVTAATATPVEVTADSRFYGNGWHDVWVTRNGEVIIPRSRSTGASNIVRTSVVLQPGARTVFDVYHENRGGTARGVTLLVGPGRLASSVYGAAAEDSAAVTALAT